MLSEDEIKIIKNCKQTYDQLAWWVARTFAEHPESSTIKNLDFTVGELQKQINFLESLTHFTVTTRERSKNYNESPNDMVNHPSHYCKGKYQCIDVMQEVFGLDKVLAFCELNAFKYQWRADSKGKNIEDKQKSIWYTNKYIELLDQITNKKN